MPVFITNYQEGWFSGVHRDAYTYDMIHAVSWLYLIWYDLCMYIFDLLSSYNSINMYVFFDPCCKLTAT